jgi:acyl carrier protein
MRGDSVAASTEDVARVRERVDRIVATRFDALWEGVRECIAQALGIDPAGVEANASLVDDLAAESIDFLDLTFRLECAFGVKVPKGGAHHLARLSIADDYGPNGELTQAALERLRILMPEADQSRIRPGLRAHEIATLMTGETFVRLVAMQLVYGTPRGGAESPDPHSLDPTVRT